jgi:hypothetical protein
MNIILVNNDNLPVPITPLFSFSFNPKELPTAVNLRFRHDLATHISQVL